jgi:hypothetical protein
MLHLRLSLPRPQTQFSSADNPTAKAPSAWTRLLTFTYLPAFNFQLLVYPDKLSFDWGMDAIPRLTTIFDGRNWLTIAVYGCLTYVIWRNVQVLLKHSIPNVKTGINSRMRRFALAKTKAENLDIPCSFCKHDLTLQRHTSACRTLNNNNSTTALSCNCCCTGLATLLTTSNFYSNGLNQFKYENGVKKSSSSESLASTSSNESFESALSNGSTTSSASSVDSKKWKMYSSGSVSGGSSKNYQSAILLSVSLLTLSFLPATNLLFYVGFVVAERILYLPSVGYCLLIGLGIGKLVESTKASGSSSNSSKISKNVRTVNGGRNNSSGSNQWKFSGQRKRQIILVVFSVLLIVFSVKTVKRNFDWINEESLFRSAIGINPPKGEWERKKIVGYVPFHVIV